MVFTLMNLHYPKESYEHFSGVRFCPGVVDFQALPCVKALKTFNEMFNSRLKT